jgi:hypothetical protein
MRSQPILLTLFTMLAAVLEAADYTTPKSGSELRKEILEAVRAPAEKYFGEHVLFTVEELRVADGFAFLHGRATQPNGKPIDYAQAPQYKADPQARKDLKRTGVLYGGVTALLKMKNKRWIVLEVTYDTGDVDWLEYNQKHGAPNSILPGSS